MAKIKKSGSPYSMVKWVWLPVFVLLITGGVLFVFLKLSDYVTCQGVMEPVEITPLFAPSSGTITASRFAEGEKLEEGEELLILDRDLLDLALKRYERDQADLTKNLAVTLKQKELQEELSAVIEDHNEEKREINKKLLDGKSMTPYDYAQAEASMEQDRISLALQLVNIEQQILSLEGQIGTTGIAIEEQTKLLEDMALRAPHKGTVILTETIYRDPASVNFFSVRPVNGLYITKGSLMGYLIKDETLTAKVVVPERKIERLAVGAPVRVTLTALPDSQYRHLEGTLSSLSASAQNGEFIGTVSVNNGEIKERFEEPEKLIGTSVTARIKLGRSTILQKFLNLLGN